MSSILSVAIETAPELTEKCDVLKLATPLLDDVASSQSIVKVFEPSLYVVVIPSPSVINVLTLSSTLSSV